MKKILILSLVTFSLVATFFIYENKDINLLSQYITTNNSASQTNITLNQINELKISREKKIKDKSYLKYDDVVNILGKGETSYPDPKDESLKVEFWTYEENGYEYFLDTTFFMDNLVNVESRLVDMPTKFKDAHINDYKKLENDISSIKSLKDLESKIGPGNIAMKYFTESDDTIYTWSYEEGFLSAYVVNGDKIIYTQTAPDLSQLAVSSTNCH